MDELTYWTQRGRQRRRSRRHLLRGTGLAGVGLVGLALIGCGGGDGGKDAAKPQTTGSAPGGGTTAAGEQPVAGGAMIALQTRDAASLDPLASQVYTTPERIGLVYPRLFYFDREEQAALADTKAVPSYITEKWELAGDGTTLTFHLRKGVKYSRTAPVNGREVVAADVKFSFDRYMTDPTSAFKARYADIASIETPDPATVLFKLKAPSAYVMYALAAEPSFVTPPEVGQQQGDYKQTLVGPGPFLHEKTTQGEGSSFKKNPDFVDAAKTYYDRYEIKVVTDAATRLAALRTGRADFQTGGAGLAKSDMQAATTGNANVKSYQSPALSNSGVWFNMQNPKWKDLRARKAISKAFNRQEIIDRLMEGNGAVVGPVPTGFGKWAYPDEQVRKFDAYTYDPAAAKQLWAAAGMPASSTIQYYIPPKQNLPIYTSIAELIGQQLKANLGIELEFSTDEYSTFVNKAYNNKFPDVAMFGMVLFDPLDYLLAQFYPGGARNGPGLNDPKVVAQLDELRGTLDEGARVKKALDIQKYLTEEVLSMAHLPQQRTYDIYNAKLRHFIPGVRPPGVEWTLTSWKVK